ncbi:MAG: PIN domain-containing protein [Burkholderiaceae bacterium]
MRALFDVNVLIALHDSDHVHHATAAHWLQAHIQYGWASCPITQNGCLRIMAQPGYAQPQPMSVLVSMLARSTSTPYHAFWSDDISLLDPAHFQQAHIHSPRQLTDLYLLALAVRHGGRLVSFDRRISLSAVPGARAEHLVVL